MRKTAHYRRIIWMSGAPKNFGDLVEIGIQNFPSQTLPRFKLTGAEECVVARRSLTGGVRFLHFITFVAGAPVAVIDMAAEAAAEEAEAKEKDPEQGQEYIQHQLFCLIKDNHVLWSSHNTPIREGAIRAIFTCFLEGAGLGRHDGSTNFDFQIVLDEKVIQELFRNGISEIDLGVGAFRPTLERLANGGTLPDDGIFSVVRSLFERRPTDEQLKAAEHIEAKLVLRTGRDWGRPEVIDLMTTVSNNLRSGYEDDFVIITKNGFRITREKMSLQRPFDVSGNPRVVSSSQVDAALRQMLMTLGEDGVLDA